MSKNRIYLTKKDKITVCETNLVTLTLESGEVIEELEPKRLFPVSRLESYITLLDPSRREVAVIRNLSDLDEASRSVIKESLAEYYFVPEIVKIHSISLKNGSFKWIVETNVGHKEFELKKQSSYMRVFPDFSIRVRDSNDNRYIIPDYRALDGHSRAQLLSDL